VASFSSACANDAHGRMPSSRSTVADDTPQGESSTPWMMTGTSKRRSSALASPTTSASPGTRP
jgi:hypothetical protein